MSNDAILATLRSGARAAAEKFLSEFPACALTSGRRDLAEQAHAMAVNLAQSRNWLSSTYAPSPVKDACQAWLDGNSEVCDVPLIAAGLLGVLEGFTPEMLRHLSWHLSGDAFDVQPIPEDGPTQCLAQLVADHVAAGGQAKLLTSEGGLIRWHAQFSLV